MKTNEKMSYHIRVGVRAILFRLCCEIIWFLNCDVDGFKSDQRTCNILPLLYQAFTKVWCLRGVDSLLCKKVSFTSTSYADNGKLVCIPESIFKRLVSDQTKYFDMLAKENGDELPF